MQTFINVIQNCLDGVMVGSTYALLGLGFSLIFGVLGRVNLAYGSTILVGVFAGSTTLSFLPGHPILALVVTVATTVIVGIYVERLCFRAIPQKAALASMVSSFAIWMQLDEFVIQSPWSQMYTYSFPAPFEFGVLGLGPLSARVDHVFMLGAAVVLMVFLWWIVSRTSFGRSMRAVSNDVDAAKVLGLNVHSIGFKAFLLASTLGGCAGYLIAISQQQVTPYFGLWATIKGLIAMIIGGMGSIPGAILGGLILGIAEIQADWFLGSEFRELTAYFLLFAFLVLRPGGLFGRISGAGADASARRA